MKNKWNRTDRKILSIASLLLLLSAVLLYDDRLLFLFEKDSNSKAFGQLLNYDHDVRVRKSQTLRWRTASSKQSIQFGDSIFTGAQSTAMITTTNGSKIEVPEYSLITFKELGNQMGLDLKFGSISGQLNGDIQVAINGENVTLSGKDVSFELDSEGNIKASGDLKAFPEGVIKKTELTENSIKILRTPEIFYHVNKQQDLEIPWSTKFGFARYKVQYSATEDFKEIINESSTQNKKISTRNYPANGDLYVRVQGDDSRGKTLSTSDIRKISFRAINSPNIILPEENTLILSKKNFKNELNPPTALDIKWNYPLNTPKYDLQISTDADFNTLVENISTPNKQFKTGNLESGTYYIRVRDHQLSDSQAGPWSPTASAIVEIEEPEGLAQPVLAKKTFTHNLPQEKPPVLQWSQVPEATHYELEIRDKKQNTIVSKSQTKNTRFDWQDLLVGDFDVQVTAFAENGVSSAPSDKSLLRVTTAVPILNPVEDLNILGKDAEDQGEPQVLNLSWKETPLAQGYEVQVADNTSFSDANSYTSETNSLSVTVEKPGQYYWRVKPINKAGQSISKASEPGVLRYNLIVPLATPSLLEPANDLTYYYQKSIKTTLWFEWTPIRQASIYVFEVANEPSFTSIVYQLRTSSTRIKLSNSLANGPLYWRVRAEGDGQRISNWSNPNTFTIFSGRIPAGRR